MVPKRDETVQIEVSSNAQTQYMRERLATESCSHSSLNKQVPSTTAAVKISSPANVHSFDRSKQDKSKGSASISVDHARVGDDILTKKKKVKRKPEGDLDETHPRPEKLPSQEGEERHKSLKSTVNHPHKSNFQPTAFPTFEQSS